MGDPGGGGGSEAGGNPGRFLERVRWRLVASGLGAACAFAAAVNEAFRWGAAAAVIHLEREVPIFGFLGVLVVGALVLPTLRRWSPGATARHADARLGLRDRLTSWVDFRGRAEVPEDMRRAQAAETAAALAGVLPADAVPIPPWRVAGPVLLAVCLVYPFLLPVRWARHSPLATVAIPGWRLGPGVVESPPGSDTAASREAAEPPGRSAAPEGSRPGDAGPHPAGRPPAEGDAAGNPPAAGGERAETRIAEGDPAGSGGRTGAAEEDGRDDPRQPDRIESERVGTRLARVVDPLYRAGEARTAARPSGGVAFPLLPQGGPAGAGAGTGNGAVAPEPARVDLEAVPARYRPIVTAYFDQLSRAVAGAGEAPQPEAGRSRP